MGTLPGLGDTAGRTLVCHSSGVSIRKGLFLASQRLPRAGFKGSILRATALNRLLSDAEGILSDFSAGLQLPLMV